VTGGPPGAAVCPGRAPAAGAAVTREPEDLVAQGGQAASRRLAVAVLLALAAGWASAAPPLPVREELPGGLELLVVPIPGAATTALRLVVRAGSAHDPAGREGLAHLLEHLLAQGRDGQLIQEGRAEGADLNAFTSRDMTRYHLDAPAGAFLSLAERFLRGITSPRLEARALQRERAVVESEDAYSSHGPNAHVMVENAVFRGRPREGSPIGRQASRGQISRDDLLAFFQRAYTTRNATLVVAGAVTPEEVRALAGRAVLLPPALPEERLEPAAAEPRLPATAKVRAFFLAATVGYPLLPADRAVCEPLAELLELRLSMALRLREPLVRDVQVGCQLLRGNPFILATAYGPSIEATDLPARIERQLAEAAARPLSGGEGRLLRQRLARLAEVRAEDPGARADELMWEAGRPRRDGPTALPSPVAGPLPELAMRAAARKAFRPERRVLLFLSPFERRDREAEAEAESE
jgi:predicted Zn-dependent peptidase